MIGRISERFIQIQIISKLFLLNLRPISECSPTSSVTRRTSFSLSHHISTRYSTESSRVSIRDCLISIIGSKGVGKSSLLQTQLCNDMLVDELLGKGGRENGIMREQSSLHSPLSPQSDVSSLRNEDLVMRGMIILQNLDKIVIIVLQE